MLLNRQAQMLGIAAIAALASAQDQVAAATLEGTATVASVQIPTQAGHLFRVDVGQRSEMKPTTR